MSLLSRSPFKYAAPAPEAEGVAPLASASTPVPEADPVAPLALALALALAAAEAASTAAAVTSAREAMEAITPAAFATADDYIKALDRARFTVAKVADAANFASAKKASASAAHDLARAKQLQAELESTRAAVIITAEAQLQAVHRFAEQMMEPRMLLAYALRDHDAVRAEVESTTDQRAPGFEPGSLASVVASLIDKRPDPIGTLATAVNLLTWEADAPARAREAAANAERAAADTLAHDRRMALAGHAGTEAQLQAHAAVRAGLASFYGRPPGELAAAQFADRIAALTEEG